MVASEIIVNPALGVLELIKTGQSSGIQLYGTANSFLGKDFLPTITCKRRHSKL